MWNPKIIDTDKSLYIAIADAIERDIRSKILQPGEKLPPQRSLAKLIGVNLTTISRAYEEAKKRELIGASVGSGTFVLGKERPSSSLPKPLSSESEILDFGLLTQPEELALSFFSEELRNLSKDPDLSLYLNYTRSEGCLRHRRIAADWLSRYGLSASPDQTLITAGAMHAINCCLMSLFRRGDCIAVDEFTFPGFKNAADFHCVKCLPVSCDEEGMLPSALEKLCERESVRGIYLMPHLQNPTTAAMSPRRRRKIAERIRRFNLILLEDDIYNWLHPGSEESLSSLVPEKSVFICGISKSLSPGLRIAFLQSDPHFFPSLNKAVSTTMWMAPPLGAELICRLIESGKADRILRRKKESLRERCRIAREVFSDMDIRIQDQSLFFWLNLPPSVDSDGLEHLALLHGIRLLSSSKFYVGSSGRTRAIRVALGAVSSSEQLHAGLESLRNLIRNYESLSSVM